MNKIIFYTGISMLLAPFLLFGLLISVIALISSGISFTEVVFGICGLAYFGVALYCIVRGVNEEDGKKK